MPSTFVETLAEGIVVIEFAEEEKLNALTPGLVRELSGHLRDLWDAPESRVVILTGRGRAFCSGADLGVFGEPIDLMRAEAYLRSVADLIELIETHRLPVIAAVNGLAYGGGAELAIASDFRVCAVEARLAFPEVGLGTIPGAGGVQRLPRMVGLARATELVLRGQPISAGEALQIGLVNRVVPAVELWEAVTSLARELAQKSPLAISYAKRVLRDSLDMSARSSLRRGVEAMARTLAGDDARNGFRALREKRRPNLSSGART